MRAAKRRGVVTAANVEPGCSIGEHRVSVAARRQPRQKRAAVTVEAILDAAALILEAEGFGGYNTNAIAERAGVSIGSLYQYFPNKAALTQALIAREDADLLNELTPLLNRPGGMGLLRELIRIGVAYQLRRPALARLLVAEEARYPQGDEASRLTELLQAIFARCFANIPLVHEPYVAQDLFSIIHGIVNGARQHGEHDSALLSMRVERAVFGYVETFDIRLRSHAASAA